MSELAQTTQAEASNDMKQSAERAAALVNLDQAAAEGDWDQGRIDQVTAQINERYPEASAPVSPAEEIAADIATLEQTPDEHPAEALVDAQAAARQKQELEARAAQEDWDQERLDRAMGNVGVGPRPGANV